MPRDAHATLIFPFPSPLFQNDTVYKCRVYDDREIVVNGGTRQLVSEIEIPVYVAEKFSDTCGEAAADGIEWPRTKKVILPTYVRRFKYILKRVCLT